MIDEIKSKTLLKQISILAYVMAAVDKDLDDEEVIIIRSFIERNWKTEYGNMDKFVGEVDRETIDVVFEDTGNVSLNGQVDNLISGLKPQLSAVQRESFLSFMEEIIAADDYINPAETALLERYKHII